VVAAAATCETAIPDSPPLRRGTMAKVHTPLVPFEIENIMFNLKMYSIDKIGHQHNNI